MKRSLRLLHHTILMTRQVLQIFEPTPLGRSLASTLMPVMLSCREDLQRLFDELDDYRERLKFTGIRNLWSRVLWSGVDGIHLS